MLLTRKCRGFCGSASSGACLIDKLIFEIPILRRGITLHLISAAHRSRYILLLNSDVSVDWKKAQKPGADRPVYDRERSRCSRQVECIYFLDKQAGSEKASMQKLVGLSEDGWCEPLEKFNVRAGEQDVVKIRCWSPNETAPEQKGRLYANGELIREFEVCGAFLTSCSGSAGQHRSHPHGVRLQVPAEQRRYPAIVFHPLRHTGCVRKECKENADGKTG